MTIILQCSFLAKLLLGFEELAVMRSLWLAQSPVGCIVAWTPLFTKIFKFSQIQQKNSSFRAEWKIDWDGSSNIQAL